MLSTERDGENFVTFPKKAGAGHIIGALATEEKAAARERERARARRAYRSRCAVALK